jgi:hypothetical protein
MIFRVIAVIVIVGGTLGALAGYSVVRWLDRRRRRADWERETEWLAPEHEDRLP